MTDMLSVRPEEGEPGSAADGFDLFGADYRRDPAATWRAVRSGRCPVAHTDKWGGSAMLARYDDIRDAARDAAVLFPGGRGGRTARRRPAASTCRR